MLDRRSPDRSGAHFLWWAWLIPLIGPNGLIAMASRDHRDERLPFLDDVSRELRCTGLAYVFRRMGHPGRNHEDVSGLVGCSWLAFQLIFNCALEHVDDFFARMRVLWRDISGIEIDPHLDHLAPGGAEIVLLQCGPLGP